MGAGRRPGARAHVPRADSPGTRAVARALAVRPRLVRGPSRGCLGPRPPYCGRLAGRLRAGRPPGAGVRAERRPPPALDAAAQGALITAVQASPRAAGIPLANWNWKAVHAWIADRVDRRLSRSSCLHYL